MRVPLGFSLSDRMTTALSSNRIVEPSARPNSLAVRTTTAFTTSLFFTEPFGTACFTEPTITSPISAYSLFPWSTRMHRIERAPVLSIFALVTRPISVRRRPRVSAILCSGCLQLALVQQGIDASDVVPHLTHAGMVGELARRVLKAQVKEFLVEIIQPALQIGLVQ